MLTWANSLFAQVQNFKGRVGAEDGKPLEYVSVALLSAKDSTAITGCATQADGTWAFAHTEDGREVLLKVSMMGYDTQYFQEPFPESITLREVTSTMKEALVARTRKYVKANPRGFIVQMEGNPLSQLPSPLDALREMPLIEGTGTNLTVLGREGTPVIYIEHRKIQDMTEVQTLNPSEIKSVEIITRPGPKYGKEVTSVIIIHLKQKHPGLAGYVSGTGSAAERLSGYAYSNLSYTFQNGTSLYAEANGNSSGYKMQNSFSDRYVPENVSSSTIGTNVGRTKKFEVTAGGSHDFRKGHSLGARYSYTRTPSSIATANAHNQSTNNLVTTLMDTHTSTGTQSWRHYANAYSYLKLSKPLSLTIDADYLWGNSPEHTAITEQTDAEEPWLMSTSNQKDYKMAAAKADLEGNWKKWTLQTGMNYSFTKNDLAFASAASNGIMPFQSSEDQERQNLYAVYGTATYQMNERWAFTGGLRCEVTDFNYTRNNEKVDAQSRNYTDWLPELGVNYTHKRMTLGLTYNSTAYRPTYSDLNNNYTYITHTSWATGNPLLKSNIIRNLEATLAWKQTYVSLTYCRRFRNFQTIYRYVPESQVNLRQNINMPGFNDFRLVVSQSFDLKWWHPSLQGMLMLEDLEYGEEGWKRSYKKPFFQLTTKNRIDLPWKIYAWVGATWRGRGNVTTVYYDRHNFSAYLQMSKSIKNWSLSMTVNDFTHTSRLRYRIDTNGVAYASSQKGSTCMLQLSATYMFNYKNKREYKGKGAAGKEMNRLN